MSELIDRAEAVERLLALTVYKSKRELIEAVEKSVSNENGWAGGVAECIDEIEDMPAAPRWHRVEDKLPVKGEIVIVSDGKRTWDVGQYRCLAFSDGDRTKWWWKGHTIKTVKWWMRKKDALPEPPKEGV